MYLSLWITQCAAPSQNDNLHKHLLSTTDIYTAVLIVPKQNVRFERIDIRKYFFPYKCIFIGNIIKCLDSQWWQQNQNNINTCLFILHYSSFYLFLLKKYLVCIFKFRLGKDVRFHQLILTLLLMFFYPYLWWRGGGWVEYVHPIFICENNRKSIQHMHCFFFFFEW